MARFYEPEIEPLARQRQALEQQLRLALERREFSLQFQPKVHAETLEVVGVEALLRWDNPALGSVSLWCRRSSRGCKTASSGPSDGVCKP